MNAGVLKINLTVLHHLLKLPDDVKLLKVDQTWEQAKEGTFTILVESLNFLETLPGDLFPEVKCTLHNEFCSVDEITHIVRSTIENY